MDGKLEEKGREEKEEKKSEGNKRNKYKVM